MTPTRRQKKTWRRRVSQAFHSRNQMRGINFDGDALIPFIFERDGKRYRKIVAPWRR